jgi:hypothetical protein
MKKHTLNLNIKVDARSGVFKIDIPEGYREAIASGDIIDETFKVIGHSKVNPNQIIIASGEDLLTKGIFSTGG